MSRRKKEPGPKLLGLARAVEGNLNRLEEAVAYQTVLRNYTFSREEIVACVLPPEDIEALRRAECLVETHYSKLVRARFRDSFQTYPVTVLLNIDGMGLALWRGDACKFQHEAPRAADFLAMTTALSRIRQRFAVVETLVEWFDKNASWGAVRYYWPSACALLPSDHLIHRLDGTIFREPVASIGAMIPLCRETAITVTEAMLCPLDAPTGNSPVSVTIGDRSFNVPLPPL